MSVITLEPCQGSVESVKRRESHPMVFRVLSPMLTWRPGGQVKPLLKEGEYKCR